MQYTYGLKLLVCVLEFSCHVEGKLIIGINKHIKISICDIIK